MHSHVIMQYLQLGIQILFIPEKYVILLIEAPYNCAESWRSYENSC